jgi:sarcosine oxidase gamma subunit
MLPPFDIFRIEANGNMILVGSAPILKSAKIRVQELMALSPGEFLILSHRTNNRLIIKPPAAIRRTTRPVVFQIAYNNQLLFARAELLESAGIEADSVLGNEAAKIALSSIGHYDLFIVGHGADLKTREEMADWLKVKYPDVPILALNPTEHQGLDHANYNLVLNGPEEWLLVVESVTAG